MAKIAEETGPRDAGLAQGHGPGPQQPVHRAAVGCQGRARPGATPRRR